MKAITKIISAAMALSLVAICFTGCHKKDETAIQAGNVKMTSSEYSCILINAYQEAVQKIEEEHEESGEHNHDSGYTDEKIDGKAFDKWVKSRAMELSKEYIAVKILAADNKVELTDDSISQIKSSADSYWQYYSLDDLYGKMGVSKSTYVKYLQNSSLKQQLFTALYGENGSKAVDKNTVLAAIYSQHDTIKTIEASYSATGSDGTSTSMTDEEKEELNTKYQGYVDRLNAGEDFKTVYCEANGMTAEDFDSNYAVKTESSTSSAKDPLETVIGSEKTSYENELFDTVNALEVGKATLYKNDSGVIVILKTDISADSYYSTALYDSALKYLKSEEYENLIKDTYKGLKFTEEKSATKQFKIKKLDEVYTDYEEKVSSSTAS